MCAGQYTAVVALDADRNEVTIRLADALGTRDVTFDPRTGQGEIYESVVRQFAVGDHIQITRPWPVKRSNVIANRAIGTITALEENGEAELQIDGQRLKWSIRDMPHADYGYAMTSYSAQSLTVSRVAVHIDTGDSRIRPLLEKALLYVGTSRGVDDVKWSSPTIGRHCSLLPNPRCCASTINQRHCPAMRWQRCGWRDDFVYCRAEPLPQNASLGNRTWFMNRGLMRPWTTILIICTHGNHRFWPKTRLNRNHSRVDGLVVLCPEGSIHRFGRLHRYYRRSHHRHH